MQSDIFGRKYVYIFAICLLAIADLLCGLSQSPVMFYIFRAVAGIGGGGITNLAMIIVSDIVTLKERGKYQGYFGTAAGLGNLVGPFLAAGFIAKTTWRAFFWMLSPMGIIGAVVAFFLLPSKAPETSLGEGIKIIDYLGVVTVSVGVIFILIPVSGVS